MRERGRWSAVPVAGAGNRWRGRENSEGREAFAHAGGMASSRERTVSRGMASSRDMTS